MTNDQKFAVGDTVIALVTMDNDLVDDGLGVQRCANKGDTLVIRCVFAEHLAVSHEHITDKSFCVTPDEIKHKEVQP